MSPETLFQLSSPLALLGWVALALAPFIPRAAQIAAGLVVPLVLSVAYSALILSFWWGTTGGFDSLPAVMRLFDDPWIALAGWLHYLAFDLLIGAWIVRTARAEAVHHLLVIPCLALTFLFGPAGFLAFHALRASRLRTMRFQTETPR